MNKVFNCLSFSFFSILALSLCVCVCVCVSAASAIARHLTRIRFKNHTHKLCCVSHNAKNKQITLRLRHWYSCLFLSFSHRLSHCEQLERVFFFLFFICLLCDLVFFFFFFFFFI